MEFASDDPLPAAATRAAMLNRANGRQLDVDALIGPRLNARLDERVDVAGESIGPVHGQV